MKEQRTLSIANSIEKIAKVSAAAVYFHVSTLFVEDQRPEFPYIDTELSPTYKTSVYIVQIKETHLTIRNSAQTLAQ